MNFKYLYFYGSTEYDLDAYRKPGEDAFKRWRVATTLRPPGKCWIVSAEVWQILDDKSKINYSINMEFQFGK